MKRLWLHLVFWLAYSVQSALLIFLLNSTRLNVSPQQATILSIYNCLMLLIPKVCFTYFVLYVTLDKMVASGFKTRWTIATALGLIAAVLLYRMLAVYYVDVFIYDWKTPRDPFFYPLAFPVDIMDIGFASGTAIAIKQIRQQFVRIKQEKMLIKEKLETELKYLRNQTNPHFLFNTLNNIYALARKKADETPEVVMKLSKLLRFMLYETTKLSIPISDEIKMLDDYIDLESIRYNDRLTVSFIKEIDNPQQPVSPLLLLPAIENAFKHGAGESRFASFIHIVLKLESGRLDFRVKNAKEQKGKENVNANIGLSNMKRQLELMYSDYSLQVINEHTTFEMILHINLYSNAKNEMSDRGR